METKVCKECGRELPIENFQVHKTRSGSAHVLSICTECMGKRISDGYAKKRVERQKTKADEVESAKRARLTDFTPRELMEELARRGYKGKLQYVRVEEIDICNF